VLEDALKGWTTNGDLKFRTGGGEAGLDAFEDDPKIPQFLRNGSCHHDVILVE
jgi:hypothetical protein